jgi:hypothetical protein
MGEYSWRSGINVSYRALYCFSGICGIDVVLHWVLPIHGLRVIRTGEIVIQAKSEFMKCHNASMEEQKLLANSRKPDGRIMELSPLNALHGIYSCKSGIKLA